MNPERKKTFFKSNCDKKLNVFQNVEKAISYFTRFFFVDNKKIQKIQTSSIKIMI